MASGSHPRKGQDPRIVYFRLPYDQGSLDVITEGWRRKLQKVWKLCGKWKEKPTPHRFRHTFARILLQKPGVTVRDVAKLLGNTEAIVLRHYGAWVVERQERLKS